LGRSGKESPPPAASAPEPATGEGAFGPRRPGAVDGEVDCESAVWLSAAEPSPPRPAPAVEDPPDSSAAATPGTPAIAAPKPTTNAPVVNHEYGSRGLPPPPREFRRSDERSDEEATLTYLS
jgi:hypothetical protein